VSLHFGVEGTSDSVALGQFDDVLCRHGSNNEIEIEFTWSPSGRTEDLFTYSGTYKKDSNGAAVVSQLRLGQGEKAFAVSRQAKGAFKLTMGDKRSPLAKSRDLHPQNSFTFSASTLAKLPATDSEEIREAGSALLEELERIIYLGPVRQLAKRHYVWDGVPPSTLGDDGERSIDALIASGLIAKKGKAGGELFIQTAHWLSQMGLAAGLDVKRVGSSLLHELVILGENQSRSNIKDVGVGVSQVLPVIVACLYAPAGHTDHRGNPLRTSVPTDANVDRQGRNSCQPMRPLLRGAVGTRSQTANIGGGRLRSDQKLAQIVFRRFVGRNENPDRPHAG
jgi:hypothetical protein